MQKVMEPSKKVEQIMVNHVEMLFGVAVKFTQNVGDAERLTRKTIAQALQSPEQFEDAPYPKRELLNIMRGNIGASFVERLFASDNVMRAGAVIAQGASAKNGLVKGSSNARKCVPCGA